jgi:polar amino acid transport system substrate-binding protein
LLSRRHLLGAAPLAWSLAPTLLPAQAPAPSARAAGTLRAVLLQLEPLAFVDAQGRQKGFLVDTLTELASETHVGINILVAPYARAAAMLTASTADLIAAIPDSQLLKENESVGMIVSVDVLAVSRAGLRLERLQDLRGKTVAFVRAARYGGGVEDESSIVHYETNSHEQSLKMLLERRVDALIGGDIALLHAMRKLGVGPDKVGSVLKLHRASLELLLARRINEPGLAEQLRKGLHALHTSGRIDALLARYAS